MAMFIHMNLDIAARHEPHTNYMYVNNYVKVVDRKGVFDKVDMCDWQD